MDKIVLEPTSQKAYIGKNEVKLCSYSTTIESELECSINDLDCLNISDYPERFIIEFSDTDGITLPFFQSCQLYRGDENHVRLNVFFDDKDGLLENGIGVNALARKVKEIIVQSELARSYEINEDIGWCCIVQKYQLQEKRVQFTEVGEEAKI